MPIWWTVIGIAALIVLFIVKKLPKFRALAALIVGLSLAYGSAGALLPRLARQAAHAAVTGADHLGATALGAGGLAVGAIIASVLVFFVIHDLWPKNRAKLRTTICALLLPLVAVAAGGQVTQISNQVHTNIVQTANLGR